MPPSIQKAICRAKQEKHKKLNFFNFNFFSQRLCFVYIWSFDSFHLDLLWENYGLSCFLGNLSIFLKKQLTEVIFECNFHNSSQFFLNKVKFVCKNNLTFGIMVFQLYLRAINNLVFCSISDIHLLHNFIMNEIQVFFFWNFFPNSQLKFST